MNQFQKDAVKLTQQLVQIDSSDPGAYEKEIGDFIFNECQKSGIAVKKEEVLPGRFNVMAKIPGEIDDPALVYICHMDTVMLGEDWQTDPLSGQIKEERLYGRGSCDMKSGMASALTAFLRVAQEVKSGKKPQHSFVFIGTVDEEDFMRGGEAAIKSGWVTKNSWCLDTEPTNGKIEVAHKGRTWFEITVNGITAHASTPWKGVDAIAAMTELLHALREDFATLPTHEDLGASTLTFGQIAGGYRPYVVPDHCKVWVDMRLVPPTTTQLAIEMVEKAIKSATAAVPGVSVKWELTGDRPYIEKDDNSYLLQKLKAAGQEVVGEPVTVSFFPGYSDTAVIAGKLKNSNCMSYGPGDLELAHKPDEYVPLADIYRCEEVYYQLAQKILF